MEQTLYWIWLREALGIGSRKVNAVWEHFEQPEQIYRQNERELAACGLFTPREVQRIRSTPLEKAQHELEKAQKAGCRIITPEDSAYPESLTQIDGMPCVLYVLGDLSTLAEELPIAIVGTRESTAYGDSAAFQIARDLAAAGCTIVSGLAIGIDTAAHEGALSVHGRTIGFLACGIDVNYPQASAGLKQHILAENGALISEFPFGETALPVHFPIRNRLIAGISFGVVVAQAPEKSGAVNTANHALRQNKDVFAVPGGIFDPSMAGCNRLISQGGKIVRNAYSVLEDYLNRFPASMDVRQVKKRIEATQRPMKQVPQQRNPQVAEQPLVFAQPALQPMATVQIHKKLSARQTDAALEMLGISPAAQKIYRALDFEPRDSGTIARQAEMGIVELLTVMTELEMADLIDELPGKLYVIRGTER